MLSEMAALRPVGSHSQLGQQLLTLHPFLLNLHCDIVS